MKDKRRILVTGGAGFIGSAVCRLLAGELGHHVVNVDKLTYAANVDNVSSISNLPHYKFYKQDICNQVELLSIFRREGIDGIIHLAAESHVDRSIHSAKDFIETNVIGTYALLEAARHYYSEMNDEAKSRFRFHHVSTDEVFGDLPFDDSKFDERTPYNPSSPYSASKAASDHLVRAWHHTYGLPAVVSNCSNNYGPFQYPEKLIPLMIVNAFNCKALPVYGTGNNVRDWLHVHDHARALYLVFSKGKLGETYAIGGGSERSNLAVVQNICDVVDKLAPLPNGQTRRRLISFVKDRLGHDRRYAISTAKIETELQWTPQIAFESGLEDTVRWYISRLAQPAISTP